MSRITVRQCNKWCCQMKPHKLRFWWVSSPSLADNKQAPTFDRAIEVANNLRSRK